MHIRLDAVQRFTASRADGSPALPISTTRVELSKEQREVLVNVTSLNFLVVSKEQRSSLNLREVCQREFSEFVIS